MYKKFTIEQLYTIQNNLIPHLHTIIQREKCQWVNDFFKIAFREWNEIMYFDRWNPLITIQLINNPIKILSPIINNHNTLKTLKKKATIKLKSKAFKNINPNGVLINKLINSNKSYNIKNEITKNNSKLFNNIFIDYSKMKQLNTIECSNINYSDRLRYNTINKDNNSPQNCCEESYVRWKVKVKC